MKITIEKEIDLESVFITAIEGGSNYWYFLDEDSVLAIRSVVPKKEDPCLSTACFKAVMERGAIVPVYDIENISDGPVGYLDARVFHDRLAQMANDQSCKWALEAEMDEQMDASSSDAVFQYLIFGEVVYG